MKGDLDLEIAVGSSLTAGAVGVVFRHQQLPGMNIKLPSFSRLHFWARLWIWSLGVAAVVKALYPP